MVSRLKDERRNTTADSYIYDLADQTASYVRDGTWNSTDVVGGTAQNYTFDANGNRAALNSTSYTSNTLNQYSAITGVPAPTYDVNGNLKTYNGWTYTYDAMNRFTIASGPGVGAYFYYDVTGYFFFSPSRQRHRFEFDPDRILDRNHR